MRVKIKITGHAKDIVAPGGIIETEIQPPITPAELIAILGIKKGLVSAVIVGNKWLRWNEKITSEELSQSGGEIIIVTPVGGG